MLLIECYDEFIVDQKIKGNSLQTLSYYKYCLMPFVRYYGKDYSVSDLNKMVLKRYALHLRARQLTMNSIKTYSKGVKAFLSWLYMEGYTEENLSTSFRLPKAQRKVIDILTDSEIQQLFARFDVSSLIGLRNYCICALMLDGGLRRSEIVRLRPDDLHLSDGYLIANGKGDKQRIVPLGDDVVRHLERYIQMRPNGVKDGFFCTKQGNPVTLSCLERMFKTLKNTSGIPRIRAHLLRHTFATQYLQNGGNIYDLQEILGHTTLDMVKVYLHLSNASQMVKNRRFSPLDRLTEK